MESKLRIDTGRIDSYEIDEDEGALTADVELTRSQVLPYRDDNGGIVHELLPPDELSKDSWLETTKGKPVTEDHPENPLNMDSISQHSKGTLHDKPRVDEIDDNQVSVKNKVTIFNDDLIQEIKDGKEQVSIGRKVDVYDESGEYRGDTYDRVQRNFRLNHLAVVDKGRAGSNVKLRMDGDMVQAEDAEWSTQYINDLPDSSFAVIEPAYENGDTENKNARHLPHHGPDGGGTRDENLDMSHLRNAFARVDQIKPITDSITASELRDQAKNHLENHRDTLETEEDTGASISVQNTANLDDKGDKPMKLTLGDKELELDVEDEDLKEDVEGFQDEIDDRLHELKDKDEKIDKLEDELEDSEGKGMTKDEVKDLLEDKEDQITGKLDKKMDTVTKIQKVDSEYEPNWKKDVKELRKDFIERVDEDVELEDKSDGYVEAKFEMLLDAYEEKTSEPVGDNSMTPKPEERDDIADKKSKLQDPEFLRGE